MLDSASCVDFGCHQGPSGEEKRVDVEAAKFTVGSDALCDVCVQDPTVDSRHLLIAERGEGIELFDIGSGSGVLVNGLSRTHTVLNAGDEIWIGGTVLTLLAQDDDAVSFTEAPSTVRAEAPSTVRAEKPQPAPGSKDDRFALLDKVRGLINSIGSAEDTFESILDTLFGAVPVRRGFIAISRADGELKVKAHRSLEQDAAAAGPSR